MSRTPPKRFPFSTPLSDATSYSCSWLLRNLRNGVSALLLAATLLAGSGGVTEIASAQESPLSAAADAPQQPSSEMGLEERADLNMVRKYYPEAAALYRQLTERQPRNALYHNKLGIAYHQMQNLDQAKRAYRRAIEINPQYAQAINNLGAVEYAQKIYRAAILTYLKALQLTPNDAVIYSNLGTAYFAYEEFEYAVSSYRYALLLEPNIFNQSGRLGTIVQQRDEKNSAFFNFYLAKSYASIGDAENTVQYLRKAWEEGFSGILEAIREDTAFEFLAGDQRFLDLVTFIESSDNQAAARP